MQRHSAVFIIYLLLHTSFLQAQTQLSSNNKKAIEWYKLADNYRARGQLLEAEDLLKQSISKDKDFLEAHHRLGLVYKQLRKFTEAEISFMRALDLARDPRKRTVVLAELADITIRRGDYAATKKYANELIGLDQWDRNRVAHAKFLLKCADYAMQNEAKASDLNPQPLPDLINSFATQYFPVLTANQQQLFFTRRLGFTGNDDEDIVVSIKDAAGNWTQPRSVSENINSTNNEGTCTISADGRKLIFTSCAGRRGYGSCDLFQSIRQGDNWSAPVNLGPNINSAAWESQPSLSADGRTLYFVSDRPGGFGQRDIYVAELGEDGNWQKARNLGPDINTPLDEVSPFIHANGQTLYFASTGHVGYGGYDIFFTEKDGKRWLNPQNLGAPVNNFEDQLSLFITSDGKKAYYSHEEEIKSRQFASVLYTFDVPASMQVQNKTLTVSGKIADKFDLKPLEASIELRNVADNQLISVFQSDVITGEYISVITEGARYALYVERDGYLFQSKAFDYEKGSELKPLVIDFLLDRAATGARITLNNIFFEFNSYELNAESLTEIEKIAGFLQKYPKMRIEIAGHTDNVGQDNFNLTLSENRAKSVYNALINSGINANLLSYKGYGSSRPQSSNDSEEGRSLNRRIEFSIISN
jgi:OmpA-OmpF porin, OOP family